jgi:hypothetical protein
LADLVGGEVERDQFGLGQFLHFIDEEHDADAETFRGFADIGEQVGQVGGQVAAVGVAGRGLDVDAYGL